MLTLPFIPRDVTPWFTALRAYSTLLLAGLTVAARHGILNLFAQAFHCLRVNIYLRNEEENSILPGRESGEGEGISVRHDG